MKRIVSNIELRAVQVLLAAIIVAALPAPASAHAVLVSSTPKDKAVVKVPPQNVVLTFDARIEKRVSQVTLRTDKREKVALQAPKGGYTAGPANQLIVPLPQLKPGAYRLEYRVLATDGHLTPGLLRFTVSGGKSP